MLFISLIGFGSVFPLNVKKYPYTYMHTMMLYERAHPDYTNYTQRFANQAVVSEALESVKRRKKKKQQPSA